MYAKIENNLAVEYPIYEGQLQDLFPDRTYPLDISGDPIPNGYVRVESIPRPDPKLDNYQYRYDIGLPILDNDIWKETYIKIDLTDAEKQAQKLAISYSIRKQRDKILDASDKFVTSDRWAGFSDQQKIEWTNYRTALRDIPTQSNFPYSVEWPIEPSLFEIKKF